MPKFARVLLDDSGGRVFDYGIPKTAGGTVAGGSRVRVPVGMRAVLIHRPGEEPALPEVRAWSGPRITAIPEVLELV